MAEKIYVLNENGTIHNLQDRQYVHANGILHAGVQCWVMNSAGEILIQRRAPTKDDDPGKWDVSFGGHCSAIANSADIMLDNAVKEGKEELGLTVNPADLIKLGEVRYNSHENRNREILGVFLLRVADGQTFAFEDGEVSEVRWTTPEALYDNILRNPAEYADRLRAVTLLKFYLNS